MTERYIMKNIILSLLKVNELFPNVMIVFICYFEHLSVDLNCMQTHSEEVTVNKNSFVGLNLVW